MNTNTLELKVPPAALGAVTALLMWLASRWAPGWALNLPKLGLIASGLTFLGAVIAVSGILSFRRARTTVNPIKPGTASSLVVSGIYRFTRNPMYLGFTLVLLALAVYFSNALALMGVPLFMVYLTRYQIRPEERALEALFPNEFTAYKTRVRRWL